MPRADYNQTVAIKQGIIAALRDNLSDEFTAKEIADALLYPPDVDGRQVGATLKLMAAEGLVAKRPYQNMNIYRLHKRALSWVPPLDDSREVAAAVKAVKAQSQAKPPAAGKVNGAPVLVPPATPARKKPKPPASKPADDHPWVHPPAVMPTIPKAAPITRPLPAHLETPVHSPASPDPGALDLDADDLAAMALHVAPQADNPMEASSQPAVDNSNYPGLPDSSTLPTDSREDEPLSQTEITPAAISGCGGKGECGHCANHAAAGELEELAEAQVARLTAQLNDAQSALADAIADLSVSQRERDLLHQRLREQDRQRAEDQNRIDALMDVARPHLAKGKASEQQGAIMAEALMELLRLALLRIPAASPAEARP